MRYLCEQFDLHSPKTTPSTMAMSPEFPSRDEHDQDIFTEEGKFRAHGVHSIKNKLNGFTILSRDGWVYESEQIDGWESNKNRMSGSTQEGFF